jgi:hypothetical protein
MRLTRGFDLVTIGGIRIAIDASWLILFALVLWSLSAGIFSAATSGTLGVGDTG